MNSNNFRAMYAELGVDIDKLGCIMLSVDGTEIEAFPDEGYLYFTSNPDRFWIKGFVAGAVPHVTLLYGLMESGKKNKKYVDEVLKDWAIPTVTIGHIGFFESPYADEDYYCIVAHVQITENLLEGHRRLEFLPHINTFPEYKAHITIAYIKKDDAIMDRVFGFYSGHLVGKELAVLGINYGK